LHYGLRFACPATVQPGKSESHRGALQSLKSPAALQKARNVRLNDDEAAHTQRIMEKTQRSCEQHSSQPQIRETAA